NHLKEKVTANDTLVIKGEYVPSPRRDTLIPQLVEARNKGERFCPQCTLGLDVKHTDVLILSQYVRSDGCMLPRRITGLCKRQQRRMGALVTMAQKAGLMPNLNPAKSKKDPKQRYQWKKYNKMSLSFGEIVEPSTRAFWDDYDEEAETSGPSSAPLEWIWYNDPEESTGEQELQKTLETPFHFVIVEGQKIGAFIRKVLLDGKSNPICSLSCGTVSIFHAPTEGVLLAVSEELEPNLFGRITQKLSPWVEAAKTLSTVTLQPAVLYKGLTEQEREKVCIIKALGTASTLPGVGPLEAPNVITGVAAGAASYRKFQGKQAAVYGCYLDSVILDSASSEPILRLLKALRVPCADRYEMKFKPSSNLYM
uniref:Large ribosomal subunit protein mL66 n=1 Tax=Anopheles dirus TaxID=7168 RepID=A0A182NA66_9DIPT